MSDSPSAVRVRELDHLSVEEAARQLGARPSYVRRIRERSESRGRPAGVGGEIRLRLPPAVDTRLRRLALARGVTPATALSEIAAAALKSG